MFILGTSAVQALVPINQLDLVGPIPQAFRLGLGSTGAIAIIIPFAVFAITSRAFTNSSMLFTATTRMPMVAGWDSLLPAWFTRLHPRYRTPINSIVFIGACALGGARSGCDERAVGGRGASGHFRRPHRGGARRLVPGREGRDPLPGRRIRLRQVGHRAGCHEPARARRPALGETDELCRHRPHLAVGPRDGAAARQSHGDDLPGADDQPQPRLHDRLADGGGADAATRAARAPRRSTAPPN